MKLWHCQDARSLRALWALEEMGLPYELEVMPFPPRFLHAGYLEVNPLGTVPYFVDGDHALTESSGICHYLVERYQQYDFGVRPEAPEYGAYLNWLYHSDATLTFPQTLYLRYTQLEPDETKALVGEDYKKWYLARLRMLNARVTDHDIWSRIGSPLLTLHAVTRCIWVRTWVFRKPIKPRRKRTFNALRRAQDFSKPRLRSSARPPLGNPDPSRGPDAPFSISRRIPSDRAVLFWAC